MKLEGLISKTLTTTAIFILIAGAVLTGVAFAVKPAAAFLPIVAGVAGAALAFMGGGGLKDKISRFLSGLKENAGKLTREGTAQLEDLKDAPRELTEINDSLKAALARINSLADRLQSAGDAHTRDMEAFESIYKTFLQQGKADERVSAIIEEVKRCCSFSAHYFFEKDPAAHMLNRSNVVEGEATPLQNIILKDKKNRILDGFAEMKPVVVENADTDESLKDTLRSWARKNGISTLCSAPLFDGSEPYGLVLFSLPAGARLTRGQMIVISLAMFVAGEIFREERRYSENFGRFSGMEVENKIFTSLMHGGGIEELSARFIHSLNLLVPMDWGGISIFDEEQGAFILYSLMAREDTAEMKRSVIPPAGSGMSWVKDNLKSWVEDNLVKTKPFSEDEIYVHRNLHARVITPLFSEKRFVGALMVASAKPGIYTDQHVRAIEKMAALLAPVAENTGLVGSLNRRLEGLKNENENLRKFYLNLGHEMRNPLNILGKIAAISSQKSASMSQEQMAEALGIIGGKAGELTRKIEDVLDFSRSQLGKMEFNPEEFFLVEVLKDVLWEFQETAKEKMISLKWDIPKEMPEVVADKEKMRTVFRELIENALSYTPEKGTISLKANLLPKAWIKEKGQEFFPSEIIPVIEKGFDQVLIGIANTGTAIPPEKQMDIFKSPSEAPDKIKDAEGGLGFGLPKVKRIIDLHRGQIWLKSKEGMGTVISFNLPQYGRSWSILRSLLEERINKARQSLASLSVISITIQEAAELKNMLPPARFTQLVKDMEKVVRTSIQDPRDVVWRLYDDETIVILSHCDIHKVASLKDQMAASIKEMRSQVLSEPPEVIFTSLTYPDEALSANELIDHLETQLKSVKR